MDTLAPPEARYEIVQLLHQGGMSCVYRARDVQSGDAVVLKEASADDPLALAALIAERETLVRLSHPGVVSCRELYFRDRAAVLVLDYVHGQTLAEVPRERITEAALADWARQIAGILAYLHGQAPPVIYRDLKPDHLILRPDGKVVLVDFGIARVKKGAARDTVPLGTPGFCPPEQYPTAGSETDEQSDIYGLGATLFHLATGKDPAAFRFDLPPVSRDAGKYSQRFSDIVARCVAPRPEDRFQSARELLAALDGADEQVRDRGAAARLPVREAAFLALGAAATFLICEKLGWLAAPAAVFWGMIAIAALTVENRRHFLWILPLSLGVSWCLGGGNLEAHLRRIPQDVLTPSLAAVPHSVLALAGLFCGGLAWFYGLRDWTRDRRIGSAVLYGGFFATLVSLCVWNVMARDTVRVPMAGFDAHVLWQIPAPSGTAKLGFGTERHKAGNLHLKGAERIEAVNAETGTPVWSLALEGRERIGQVAEGALYRSPGGFTVINEADGKPGRTWTVPGHVRSAFEGEAGMYAMVDDRSILHLEDGRVAARLDADSLAFLGTSKHGLLLWQPDDRVVMCVTPDLSKTLWKAALPARAHPVYNQWQDAIFAVGRESAACLEAASGEVRFKVALAFDASGMRNLKDQMMVTAGTALAALDQRTGATLWMSRPLGEQVWVHDSEDGFYVDSGLGKMFRVNPEDGEVAWEHWGGGLAEHVLPRLGTRFSLVRTVRGAVFYVDTAGTRVTALDSASGAPLWTFDVPAGSWVRDMTWSNGRLYLLMDGASPRVACFTVTIPERR